MLQKNQGLTNLTLVVEEEILEKCIFQYQRMSIITIPIFSRKEMNHFHYYCQMESIYLQKYAKMEEKPSCRIQI